MGNKAETVKEISVSKNGTVYESDNVKKTCKKVMKAFSDLKLEDLEVSEMSMNIYQRYLKDKFNDESCTIKKDKLYFRGYRISCSIEQGFLVEDSTKRYAVVETTFEGIPTPAELGEFFKKPQVTHTPEELKAAIELGKKKAAEHYAPTEEPAEEEEIDFDLLRKKVISQIIIIRKNGASEFDPMKFADMIPFKRWKRKVTALLKDWKSRKIRYKKLLDKIEEVTNEETFVVEDKAHRNSFVGTLLPTFKEVGLLKGDKIEVDGVLKDAVPFIQDYLLHYEPRVMPQLMRFAGGVIEAKELLENPFYKDWKIDFNKKLLENTPENAKILSLYCHFSGVVAPQDLVYDKSLNVGDKILLLDGGKLVKKTITETEYGVCINGGIGLTKFDKYLKVEVKDEE